jgi:hypothetical protein
LDAQVLHQGDAKVNIPERPLQPPHRAPDRLRDEDEEYEKWRQKQLDEELGKMKFCMDCAWFIVHGAKCAKAPRPVDFVSGQDRGYFDAQIMRESAVTGCGPDAKWFKIIPVAA